jgi:magnesium and cobalt transporter
VARRRETPSDPPARRARRHWRRARDEHGDGAAQHLDAEASEQERIIIEALGDLRDMDVREVMTPRTDVVYLTIPVHADDIAKAVRTSGHSCFPVVVDDLDDLIGILFVNDIFRTGRGPANRDGAPAEGVAEGEDREDTTPEGGRARDRDATDPSPMEISRKVRQPYLVPESLGILEALADMRKHRRAVAVVVDEYGGVAGLLTVKDLLEPLVGDLHDEFDEEEEATIVRVDNTRWLIEGQTNVDDVGERLGMDIPDGEYVTMGGLLFEEFGHIPSEGEEVRVGDWNLRVVEMDKRRVAQVVATYLGGEVVPGPGGEGATGQPGRATAENGTGETAG